MSLGCSVFRHVIVKAKVGYAKRLQLKLKCLHFVRRGSELYHIYIYIHVPLTVPYQLWINSVVIFDNAIFLSLLKLQARNPDLILLAVLAYLRF